MKDEKFKEKKKNYRYWYIFLIQKILSQNLNNQTFY